MEKKRIEYIDAMRGFTMILVVLNHVAGFCMDIDGETPSFNTYFYEFRMPLFFFVSGFVLYKNNIRWNLSFVSSFLKKKFPIQIISTSIFFIVFTYINREDILVNLMSDSKNGYWFTVVLFVFFVMYSFIRYIAFLFRFEGWIKDVLILSFGGIFFILTIPSVTVKMPIDKYLLDVLCFKHWCYFVFFTIGTIVKKHFDAFRYMLDGQSLILCCLILFFGLNIFKDIAVTIHYYLFRFLTALSGIFIVLSFFKSRSVMFSNQTIIGKWLCYIGRRTLDIYFLHYFLLPYSLSELVPIFHEHPMPIIEFFVSLSISLIIIAISLLISNILRLSPVLGHWLFGVRK